MGGISEEIVLKKELMSKLSILQQILPLTFYEGWKKASSPQERDMHSTSTVLFSSCVSLTGSPSGPCEVD